MFRPTTPTPTTTRTPALTPFRIATPLRRRNPIAAAVIATSAAIMLAVAGPAFAQYGPNNGPNNGPAQPVQDAGDEGMMQLPITFAGDGMTVVIQTVDPNTGSLSGTITLAGQQPMPFVVEVREDQQGAEVGAGRVRTAAGMRPIHFQDESDTVARVQFEGKTYRVVMGAQPQPQPNPPVNPPINPPRPGPDADANPLAASLDAAYKAFDAKDYATAMQQFRPLAEAGDVNGQYMVGLMYHRGHGVPVDGQQAARWYQAAADQNNPAALTNLGILYRDGVAGLPADKAKALDLLRRAAYIEDSAGQLAYGAMMANGAQNDAEFIEGVAFVSLAAEQGDQTAINNMRQAQLSPEHQKALTAKLVEIRQAIAQVKAIRSGENAQQGGEGGEGGDVIEDEMPPVNPNPAAPAPFGVGLVPHGEMPGWVVREIDPGSIAEAAGLKLGDVIIDAKDGNGAGIPIQPDLGFDPLRKVLMSQVFTLVVVREGTTPPIFEVKIERPGAQPRRPAVEPPIERADAGGAGGGGQPAGTLLLTPTTFADAGMGGMKSHTMLVPKGWTTSGGAFWASQQAYNIMPSFEGSVTGPEGQQVTILANVSATWNESSTLPPAQKGGVADGYITFPMPNNPQEWNQFVTETLLPGQHKEARDFRVTNARILPELTQSLKAMLKPITDGYEQQNQQNRQMGMSMFTQTDCAFIAFECTYTENGKQYESLVTLQTGFARTNTDFGQGVGTLRTTNWWLGGYEMRVPQGMNADQQLPVLLAVGNSLRETPEWAKMKAEMQANISQTNRKINADNLKGIQDRGRIMSRTNAEIAEINQRGYEQRQATNDRINEKVTNAILGTEDYILPGHSDYVQLPNTHNYVFTNQNGDYILSNDINYDPNRDQSLKFHDWEKMQPRP